MSHLQYFASEMEVLELPNSTCGLVYTKNFVRKTGFELIMSLQQTMINFYLNDVTFSFFNDVTASTNLLVKFFYSILFGVKSILRSDEGNNNAKSLKFVSQ